MSAFVALELSVWSVAGLLDAFLLGAVLMLLVARRYAAWATPEKVRGDVVSCAHVPILIAFVELCRMRLPR